MSVKTPDFLFDSYKAYKRDTEDVAAWLAESARKCRQELPGQNPEKGKTEGKAPALWEYVPLAKIISAADTSVEVPRAIVSSLKSLIGKRRKCYNWFSGQSGDDSHALKNSSHDHAISTFEQVLLILRSRIMPAPNVQPNSHSHKDEPDPVNAFEALNVEDAFSDDEDEPIVFENREQNPRFTDEHSSGPCLGCIQAHLAFQCYCFYGDLDQYRQYLRLLWRHYRDGELDLMTVSVITDTTFDILERAENEFCPDFSMLGEGDLWEVMPKYELTSGYLYLKYCQCYGQDSEFREHPEDDINFAMYDTATWLCMPTQKILTDLFAQLPPAEFKDGAINMFPFRNKNKPEEVPWETGSSKPWEELTPREQLKADRNILKEFIFSMETIRLIHKSADPYDNGIKSSPWKDRLSKGFLEALESRSRPKLWLVFAAQIYLDIRHILEKESTRGLEELRSIAADSVTTIKEMMEEQINDAECENWDFLKNKAFTDLTNALVWWIGEDHVKWLFERFRGPKVLPRHHLFSIHPVLCGVMSFNITLTMQDLGLQFSSSWKAIIAVAHLYNASRQSGLTATIWPDMETFIGIHPKTFSGDRPQAPEEFHPQAMKALEWTFIPDRFLSNTKRRKAEKLGLRETCTISSIFINRYAFTSDSDAHLHITLRDIESLLNKSASRDDIADNTSFQPNPKRAKAGKAARNKHVHQTATRAALVKQVEETRRLGPIELLETLRLGIGAELIPALTFNYLTMHVRCMKILRDVHRNLDSYMKSRPLGMPMPGSEPPGSLLPTFVLVIFNAHANPNPFGDPLKRVCEAMNRHIQREYRVENDRMAALEKAWFWSSTGKRECLKGDVIKEAKGLLSVIGREKKGEENFIAHFKQWQQDFIPFESLYRPLYAAKEKEGGVKKQAEGTKEKAKGTADGAKEKTAKEQADVDGEKTKKKRKRTKKKKKAASNGEDGAEDAEPGSVEGDDVGDMESVD